MPYLFNVKILHWLWILECFSSGTPSLILAITMCLLTPAKSAANCMPLVYFLGLKEIASSLLMPFVILEPIVFLCIPVLALNNAMFL